MKRLIVNADDFGFTRDVNAGIIEAHRNGILTATTLMANGDAFNDAISLAASNPSLDIGCHLVFVQGQSVLEPERKLPATLTELVSSVLRNQLPLYEEARAQITRIIAAGINPSHIDTHKHTHLLPPILKVVAQVAREFQIPWVRRPFDFDFDPHVSLRIRAVTAALRLLAPNLANALDGLRSTDHFTGFQLTGSLTTASLCATLERLPDGLTEFMCHPGQFGPELRAAPTRLKESRQTELAALVSPAVRTILQRRGIELVNYRQLA